jgi:hypothetical protein
MRWIGCLASGVVLLGAINSPAKAAIECRAELPQSRSGHWSWRQIEGRKCWFPGRAGVDKAQLRWPTAEASPRAQPETRPPADEPPQSYPSPAKDLTVGGPPQAYPSATKELTFEQRWVQ